MCKEEYIKRYGSEAYEAYKKKQAELTKTWREKNREKSRKYGLEYYHKKNPKANKRNKVAQFPPETNPEIFLKV